MRFSWVVIHVNYSNIKYFDIANGSGCRTSIFVSGCRNHCDGCFNKETWSFDSGEKFTKETISEIISRSANSYIKGLSVLGGEPLDRDNQFDVLHLIICFRNEYPDKDIWLWTGYTYEELMEDNWKHVGVFTKQILDNIDILVDGRYEKDKHSIGLRFRGSSNQRIIDIPKSIKSDALVLWQDDEVYGKHSW